MRRVYSWVLSTVGQAQVRGRLSEYLLIQGGKGSVNHGGQEVSWMDPEAGFGARPFLRKPPFKFLDWAGCDCRYPKGWLPSEARVALCTSMAPRLLL